MKSAPAVEKYPYAYRWHRHMSTFQSDFSSMPGDPSKAYTAYGPTVTELPINPKAKDGAEDDDEVDLFGSDDEEEDAEAARIREERLAEYAKKKAGKVKPAAKSIVTMDVKPWDDETDMKELEAGVRGIQMDGLVWGASKLVAVGYGIKKLQINLVVEDEKVSTNDLQEKIEEAEDYVQSTDIVSNLYRKCYYLMANALLGCHAEAIKPKRSECSGKNSMYRRRGTPKFTVR